MSGIAGIVDRDKAPVACEQLQSMMNAMEYRGPDGRSSDAMEGARFGYLALNSTGRGGSQPVCHANCLLVADVHLVDRDRLVTDLSCNRDLSDPELLLEAYLAWGKNCVQHLRGSFAFAVFDGDCLFLARDHMGVKPLYYADSPGRRICFASEARAVARAMDASLSEVRFADSLAFPLEHVDKVSTPWEGVYRLPPGTCLIANQQGVALEQYWDGREVAPRVLSEEEWTALFRETLLSVLEDHQVSGKPMAMTLSGGVDSGTLACVAASAGMPVECFSTVQDDDPRCLETKHIRLAISQCNLDACLLNPHEIDEDADFLLTQLSSLQEPFDAHMLQLLILNLAAKRRGHQSLIDGVDGEMIFSMPSSYPSLLYRFGFYRQGFVEAWQGARINGGNPLFSLYGSLRGLGTPGFLRKLKRRFREAVGSHEFATVLRDGWISAQFAEEQNIVNRLREMHDRLYGDVESLFEAHRRSVTHPAISAALERYDRIAALSGVEARHPLLDLRLVELMLSTPAHLKVRHGWSKYLLRRAGAPDVPQEISWRRDKEENAWRFSERLVQLKGSEMRRYLDLHSETFSCFFSRRALSMTDESLVEVFAICHWLESHRGEFDFVS